MMLSLIICSSRLPMADASGQGIVVSSRPGRRSYAAGGLRTIRRSFFEARLAASLRPRDAISLFSHGERRRFTAAFAISPAEPPSSIMPARQAPAQFLKEMRQPRTACFHDDGQ